MKLVTSRVRYPLVCFDLDGTLVDDTIYIWKTLHEGFCTNQVEREQAFNDYFSGHISYAQWFIHDLKLLKEAGANRDAMLAICGQLKAMNGALETLHKLRQSGHKVAVISGSIQMVLDVIFPDFKFDYVLINQIQFDTEGQICGGTHTPFDIEEKANGLKYLCGKEKIAVSESVFIGDNENDIWIAKAAGYSIAFNCKSTKLAQICNVEIHEKDLRRVLPYIFDAEKKLI